MSRSPARAAVAALALLLLAGCPIPQPLPDYPKGTITPPRILADEVRINGEVRIDPLFLVPMDCTGTEPSYALDVKLYDTNNIEQVEARWFVDYADTQGASHPIAESVVPASTDPTDLTRAVPTFTFLPYQHTPFTAGTVHVVELVVSNNFASPPDAEPLAYRRAEAGFETQLYRWVFELVPGTNGCP